MTPDGRLVFITHADVSHLHTNRIGESENRRAALERLAQGFGLAAPDVNTLHDRIILAIFDAHGDENEAADAVLRVLGIEQP